MFRSKLKKKAKTNYFIHSKISEIVSINVDKNSAELKEKWQSSINSITECLEYVRNRHSAGSNWSQCANF